MAGGRRPNVVLDVQPMNTAPREDDEKVLIRLKNTQWVTMHWCPICKVWEFIFSEGDLYHEVKIPEDQCAGWVPRPAAAFNT